MLDLLLPKVPEGSRLRFISDAHPGISRTVATHPQRRDQQMHAVDALHSLIRHTCAHHRRETIAFGRRTNALVERGFLMAVWRNFVKKVTERRRDRTTAAMEAGLTDSQWDWERVLARRLFPDRVELPPGWGKVYRREWITASIGANTLHRARFSF